MTTFNDWLGDARVVAVVDNQFGDTGKGKFVDLLAERAEIIARGTGGANAGHTICLGSERFAFHLIPSGILHDRDGKVNIIGSGVAVDPYTLYEELAALEMRGCSTNHLKLAYNAKLVLPPHRVLDQLRERLSGSGRLGTTGRGIGPAYRDHTDRIGLTVNDLLNKTTFAERLERNLAEKRALLQQLDPAIQFDAEAITREYLLLGERLAPFVTDTDTYLQKAVRADKRIVLEGAQGLLLSVDHGTYPYVTSCDCSVHGLARGVGLPQSAVKRTLGITKAFYMTRVGEGPFPTELGGDMSASWCSGSEGTREKEAAMRPSINDPTPFLQGIAIRQAGKEYGTTTGRPRRTGWLDLPLLRYAATINGGAVALSMIDVLNECAMIRLCTHYIYQGPDYRLADRALKKGDIIEYAYADANLLAHCEPQYHSFPGWQCAITSEMKSRQQLPPQLRELLLRVEAEAKIQIVAISVGPDRHQTILL